MNIMIIGAGPIGCYAGYLLAKTGHNVTIYENHPSIGAPIQCTGILTSDFDEFNFPMDSFLVNTIDTIEVFSPNDSLKITQKDYIVCRTKFDNFFADLAKKEGAVIHINHSFQRREDDTLIIKNSTTNKEIRVTPDIIIAADGPLSPTAKAFGFYNKRRKNYYGVQAVVEGNFEPHTIKTYFGKNVCPGLFAWVVPESPTTARVGLAMRSKSKQYFDKFMKEHAFTAKEMQAGTIPVYHPLQRVQLGNCFLVGDASSYVKATTLGGIVPAMKQVQTLVKCINENRNYYLHLTPLRRKLWLHLVIQKILAKFSDKDWDRLIRYVKQPKIQNIFERYTRDNPIPLVTLSLFKEPRFLLFAKYLF